MNRITSCWRWLHVAAALGLGLASAVPAPARAADAAATTSAPASGTVSLSGYWAGTYSCGHPAGLEFVLKEDKTGRLSGKASFFPRPENPKLQSGAYHVHGNYAAGTGKLVLAPGSWIVWPWNYYPVAFRGRYVLEKGSDGASTEHIKGSVVGCRTFDVQRVTEEAAVRFMREGPHASITMPDCAGILSFADTLQAAPKWHLGSGRLLPEPFHSSSFARIFGVPALDWSALDETTAYNTIRACVAQAVRQKKRDDIRAFNKLTQQIRWLAADQKWIALTDRAFDADFRALIALPPSLNQLTALAALDRAHAEGVSVQFFPKSLRVWLNQVYQAGGKATHRLFQLMWIIRGGPDGISDRMYPALPEKRAVLTKALMRKEKVTISAVPATLEGLKSLTAMRQKAQSAYVPILSKTNAAALANHLADREKEIQAVLASGLKAEIPKAPDNADGLRQLAAIAAGPTFAALDSAHKSTVAAEVGARRGTILDGMVAAATAKLATYPDTLDGFRGVAKYAQQVRLSLAPVVGPARTERFEAAYRSRDAAIGNAVLPAFTSMLDSVPKTRKGLAKLKAIEGMYGPATSVLPSNLQPRYAAAIAARQQKIGAAIKAEDERLAAATKTENVRLASSPPVGAIASSASAWSIKTHVDQMTDKTTTYAVDAAKSSITNTYGMKFTPQLLLACPGAGNKVQIYLNLGDTVVINGDIAGNIHPANIRFDKNEELKWHLSAASDGKGYYFNDPEKLLRKGSKSQRMLLQFTTIPTSQTFVVDFDISGTDAALSKMQCH